MLFSLMISILILQGSVLIWFYIKDKDINQPREIIEKGEALGGIHIETIFQTTNYRKRSEYIQRFV